jgi:hypothetical protein
MGMRQVRVLVSSFLVGGSILVAVEPAAASCISPSIGYDVVAVSPGGSVRVTGDGWGTDCYDQGNRPSGVGNLGEPRTGIEVVVLQDGVGPVVARGSADTNYRFAVDVPIPPDVHAGTLTIAARAGSPIPQVAAGPELAVSSTGAVDAPREIAFLEPAEDSSTSSTPWLAGAAGVLAVVLGVGTYRWPPSP